jgi:hypothetical protein
MRRTACTEPQCLYKGALYFYLYQYEAMYCFRLFVYLELTHNATPLLFHYVTVQRSDVSEFV